MARLLLNACLAGIISYAAAAPAMAEVKEVIPCVIPDKQNAQLPDASHLDGFLGNRINANASNRLAIIDESRLLDGFRNRPGQQTWDGEHVGKWLHAATLAWSYNHDPQLKQKLDRVAAELGKWQLADGYLGTYLPEQRWTEWDVWTHKYDLIGLLTYYRFTGNTNALETSRRCADLLCRTFGTGAGQRDILKAGWHMGMAPTSVLEPMVRLYRYTGDPKYLAFCRYILASWETPEGPKIISTLLKEKRADKVGDGKAYEMLSCLNGALEYYRTTGDQKLLQAALNAWQDIVTKRLYLTGTASHHEHFHDDYDLPNGNAKVGETCVTVTWLQFNAQLLRLTGEARFAEELERTVYNQLLGAQQPDGSAWGYYVQLEGRKPYACDLSGNCCLSSGPRGIALIPTFAFATDDTGIVINFLNPGTSRLQWSNHKPVRVEIDSKYPGDGNVRIKLRLERSSTFTVKLRVPAWASTATLSVNGHSEPNPVRSGKYAVLQRKWHDGDTIELAMPMPLRAIVGEHGNRGKVAFACGPLILAADDALNPDAPIGTFAIPENELKTVTDNKSSAPKSWVGWSDGYCDSISATLTTNVLDRVAGNTVSLRLAPFAYAGCTLAPYQVWLPLAVVNSGGSTTR